MIAYRFLYANEAIDMNRVALDIPPTGVRSQSDLYAPRRFLDGLIDVLLLQELHRPNQRDPD